MAILIPNEQITPTCKHCLFADVEIPAGTFWCRLVQKDVIEEGRPDWCPLKEVVECKDCAHEGECPQGFEWEDEYVDIYWCQAGERREE